MQHGVNGKSVAGLDEKLAEYQNLREEFDRLRVRLRRADQEKQSVNQHIFEKVTGEYNRQLDDVRSRMTPLKEALDEIRVEIERELAEAAKAVEQAEEALSEIRFRHLVGEYTDEQHEELIKSNSSSLGERRQRHTDLKLLLDAFDAASDEGTSKLADVTSDSRHSPEKKPTHSAPAPAPTTPTTPNAPTTQAPAALRGTSAPPAPAAPAERRSHRSKPADGFVDPNEWFEDQPDAGRSSARNAPRRPSLSDRGSRQPDVEGNKVLPNLLVRTGSHSGRQIPLLPMTMSIGREHDNNIEIKDPEVARYHARLRYEQGEFTVEDLDSSTGTFINGLRVKEALLHDGDVLRVGGTELAVEQAKQTT